MPHTRNGPEHAAEDLKSKVADVGDSLREVGSHVRDAAKEQYENVRDRAAGYVDAGREKAREMEEGVESYVQENPISRDPDRGGNRHADRPASGGALLGSGR